MINCLKKNSSIIIVAIIALVLILINAKWGYIIMGVDNASPYFNPVSILERIKGTSAIIFGGIVFQIPFLQTLKLIGLTPELISNAYVFTNFFFGIIGMALILREHTKNIWGVIAGTVIFVTSLFTFFIFSQPNFLFLAAYGSIPMLIYILSKEKLNWYHWVLLIVFSIGFLTTTLNIIAFLFYLAQIILFSLVLSSNKKLWKRSFMWGVSLILFWLVVMQIITALNGDSKFFATNIYNYFKELVANVYMPSVTTGIIASEKTNTLVRTLSFALGWMELHNSSDTPIFEFYSVYRENLVYILLGLIPFLLSFFIIVVKREKKNILLLIILILFILISSTWGISIIEKIPYISSGLRWASSKLWPMYIFPIVILASSALTEILQKSKSFGVGLLFTTILLLCVYGEPVLNGHLTSSKTLVNIPSAYLSLPTNSKILVLPHAQRLYMRDFDWGYYGSDFLSYTSNSEIVDGANMYEYANKYEEILSTGTIPDDIDYVLYNVSAEANLDDTLKIQSQDLVKNLKVITSNSDFVLYEK